MQLAILYVSTAVVFLIADAIMLGVLMKPLFLRHIGGLMADPIRMAPAAIFYLAYVAGLLYLVSWPALKSGGGVVLAAAVLGGLAYGTFEFTNYAILRDWHWTMVVADTSWGAVLTAFSAWAGLTITRALTG